MYDTTNTLKKKSGSQPSMFSIKRPFQKFLYSRATSTQSTTKSGSTCTSCGATVDTHASIDNYCQCFSSFFAADLEAHHSHADVPKLVRFAPKPAIRLVPSWEQFSEEERAATWWDRQEYAEIFQQCRKEVMKIEQGVKLKDKKYCKRGLDRCSQADLLRLKCARSTALDNVLDEQRRQKKKRISEPILIARVNIEKSNECLLWAQKVGRRDYRVVEKYMEDVRRKYKALPDVAEKVVLDKASKSQRPESARSVQSSNHTDTQSEQDLEPQDESASKPNTRESSLSRFGRSVSPHRPFFGRSRGKSASSKQSASSKSASKDSGSQAPSRSRGRRKSKGPSEESAKGTQRPPERARAKSNEAAAPATSPRRRSASVSNSANINRGASPHVRLAPVSRQVSANHARPKSVGPRGNHRSSGSFVVVPSKDGNRPLIEMSHGKNNSNNSRGQSAFSSVMGPTGRPPAMQ